MNGRALVEQLASAGLDEVDIPSKTRLFDSTVSAFEGLTGSTPQSLLWVPGRLEVFGTHTDYAGGRTLVAALPRGFAFVARRRSDRELRIADAVAGESASFDTATPSHVTSAGGADAPARRETGWRHYVQVVVDRLRRNFPGAALGADITFASDLPRAAGMSSSSALIVGVASTLVRLADIYNRAEWRADISGTTDEAGYYACIENGRTFGRLPGEAGVGTHGGSEDHAAMVCGEARTLLALAFVPMRRLDSVRLPDDWRIAIASSGVAAEKTGAAIHSYNRLARGAAILLDLWNASHVPARSLASALSEPSAAIRLQALTGETSVNEWTGEALRRRLEHFVREDSRIPEAVRAFRMADRGALNALARGSQSDAEHLLFNQVEETAGLARIGLDEGAFATRSFGAGFGGSVWALVGREDAPHFTGRWLEAYRRLFPERPNAVTFIAHPGPGLIELSQ